MLHRFSRALTPLKPNIHIQNDFIVFGYGGFYAVPKGWGLDIAYINLADVRGPGAKARLRKRLQHHIDWLVKSGVLTEVFVPNFTQKLYHTSRYEWDYETCRVMFEYARAGLPAFRKYTDFRAFVAECLGGRYGVLPEDLLKLTRERIRAATKENMDRVIASQRHFMERHAEDVLKRIFSENFGHTEGMALFDVIYKANKGRITLEHSGDEASSLFFAPTFTKTLHRWHQVACEKMAQPEFLTQAFAALPKMLRDMKIHKNPQIARARRDTLKTLTEMEKPLLELLGALDTPIFIATDSNANFYRGFFSSIPLAVTKESEELQEYTVYGMCMYQPHQLSGVIVTRGGRSPERFWHTLCEEVMHLADGPVDRARLRGHHRYSGTAAFQQAYYQDRAANITWERSGELGPKEWGQALTLHKVPRFVAARIQKRIAAYEATLAFDHYPPAERMAESFAAIPIIMRAAGKKYAAKIMPHMVAFYEQDFFGGIEKEIAQLAQ